MFPNKITLYKLLFIFSISLFAQQTPTKNNAFDVGLEYRPRAEYRNGYRTLPNNKEAAAFFISHRARLNIDFTSQSFYFHTTLQDIRVWGDTDPRDSSGKAQFYEFYVQPYITQNLSIRVGRQRIKFDNQRLFAENNWRQAGGQHDAVRVMYRTKQSTTNFIGAYNQNEVKNFGNSFDIDWDIYRTMFAWLGEYKITKNWKLTSIQITDEYTDPNTNNTKGYWKFTNGGRVTYQNKQLHLTLAGYYQWGKIENGKPHQAYYLEPEIKWSPSFKYQLKIGAQIFSGDSNKNDGKSTSFLAQYGAFHKHNGGLDYTQRTVRTNEHEGIINPYLQQNFTFNKKTSLNWQSHLLGANIPLLKTENNATTKLSKLYAWENDFSFFYLPNKYTKIELAYLFLIPNESIKVLPTGENGDTSKLAHFAYLSVNWTPKLLNL